GMRGRGVEIEVALLDVLTVVTLRVGQPKQTLLEDRIAAVPQREREAQPPLPVGDAEQAVLAPAEGTAARVVGRGVLPAGAACRVVLTHGAPLAFGEIGPPALPVLLTPSVLGEPLDLRLGSRSRPHPGGARRTFAGAAGRRHPRRHPLSSPHLRRPLQVL